jgi:hypothetical protein
MDLPIWFPLGRELLAEASALIGKPSKSEWISKYSFSQGWEIG